MHLIVRAILQIWPYVNNEPKAHLLVCTGHTLGPTWLTRFFKGDVRATTGSNAEENSDYTASTVCRERGKSVEKFRLISNLDVNIRQKITFYA